MLMILIAILFSNCSNSKKVMNRTMDKQNEKVYVTALYYFNEGGEDQFNTYRLGVNEVFKRHDGYLDKVIKPIKLLKGTMDLPDEIHFGTFSNSATFEATGLDAAYQELVVKYREPALKKMIIIISKDAHSDVPLEIGNTSKFYAVTLLNIKDGEMNKSNFEDYLSKSCEIMPEFGAHFEKFLIPSRVKGEMELPSKVHLFYFDTMDGAQKMAADPRMLELYPVRDKALSSATLILGKAL